jgi:hypothetical protein
MERLAALLFSTFVVALAAAGTTSAADGSFGPWEATSQGSITAPAGYVCRFTITRVPLPHDRLVAAGVRGALRDRLRAARLLPTVA